MRILPSSLLILLPPDSSTDIVSDGVGSLTDSIIVLETVFSSLDLVVGNVIANR